MSAGTNRIITPLIVAFILATTAPTFAGKIIYVDDDGPADFNNIQAAIDDSNDGDTIIVAEGRYFENINFNGSNITLTSTDPCSPDVVAATIIDGNHNGSVVTFNNGEDANCVLNGFTITNGNAGRGGGICCGSPGPPGAPPPPPPPPPPPGQPPPPEPVFHSPTIKNCIISNNSASFGGGMYNNWASSPTLRNCTFNSNSATDDGGGIHNRESSPTLKNCSFSGNSAVRGGRMFNLESSPTITNCTFNENSAQYSGGGMYNGGHLIPVSQSSPILTNCTFNENSTGGSGGGMCNSENSPTLKNCTFSGNSATDGGGGMFNSQSSPILTNCTFNENSANSGGGMCNQSPFHEECRPVLTNCTFNKNSADSGGGMCNQSPFHGECHPVLTNCVFNENSANSGGGMFNQSLHYGECHPMLTNCTFSGNSAVGTGQYYGYGGGMYNNRSNPIVANCAFTGNEADYHHGRGGGIYNTYSNSIVTNCTFTGNKAGYDYYGGSGGMYNHDSYTMVSNCIFWNNGSSGISVSSVDATYCNIEGGWPGEGNIDVDPCFVDLGYWDSNDTPQNPRDDDWIDGDYHLLPDSPCINAGDPNHLYDPNERELDGNPRVIGCRIDMGAFEYRHLVPAEVRIVPHTINLANKSKWITAYLQFPENYNVAEIDFCILHLEDEIEPEQLFINEKEQVMMARFNHEQLQAILNPPMAEQVELTISAQLTDATVFEGTDVIKVIYEGGGKLAKLSGKASNPNPADGAMDVGLIDVLSWTAGSNATSHDVYFGTNSPPPFIGNQTATTFDPGTMAFDTTYFWRIDEVNKWGTTTGDLWSFTTLRRPPPPPPPPPW